MTTTQIADGVNVHVIHSTKFRTTTVGILIRRRLSRSEAAINAVIPGILKRGSERYPSLSRIYGHTEELYGAIFDCAVIKKGEEQIIQFIAEVVKKEDLTKQVLIFLSEIMLRPLVENGGFKKEIAEGEIENLRKAISDRINNKKEYAKLRCIEEACKDEPFGVYGDGYAEDLDGLDAKKIYSHYLEILKTSPIEFVVIGDENEHELAEHISANFKFERGQVTQLSPPELNYGKKEEKKIYERMDVTQGKISIALRSGVPQKGKEFYDLMAGNELFGGFTNSKLFTGVREKESLCYYISSFVYKFKTIVMVQCGVEEKNFDKVISLIKEQIKAVASGDFTLEEFENARTSIIKKYGGIEDYPAATLDFYVSQYMLGDTATIEDVKHHLAQVSPSDAASVFKRIYVDTVYCMAGGREE